MSTSSCKDEQTVQRVYCPEELVQCFKDAVVVVHSEFILLGVNFDNLNRDQLLQRLRNLRDLLLVLVENIIGGVGDAQQLLPSLLQLVQFLQQLSEQLQQLQIQQLLQFLPQLLQLLQQLQELNVVVNQEIEILQQILQELSQNINTPDTVATSSTSLRHGRRVDIILEGNGFFIKGYYIVTPAHLVLMPPSLTSVVNRYPFIDRNSLTLDRMKNQMVRASRILVSVFNVNGKGCSYVYEADLIGVDGAGDVAVLKIDHNKKWNLQNPCITKDHPYFRFGSSKDSKPGEKVYLLGDHVGGMNRLKTFNSRGITEAILSDNHYVDYEGFVLPELVLVSASVGSFSSGLPIVNKYGEVIGMQTSDSTTNTLRKMFFDQNFEDDSGFETFDNFSLFSNSVYGPSEFFMRRVVKSFVKGSRKCSSSSQLEKVNDPAGSYFRFKKSYLGIAYTLFTGSMYDTTDDFTSLEREITRLSRVRLDSEGKFLNPSYCKELIGIKIFGIAGLNPNGEIGVFNGLKYVPGGSARVPFPENLPVSPLLGILQPGDVITCINGVPVGDSKQIAPSLITWRLCPGEKVEITFKRGGNAGNAEDNSGSHYEKTYKQCVELIDFPQFLDYPWYAVVRFPTLKLYGFIHEFNTSGGRQIVYPYYPQIYNGAHFHPPI